MTSARASFCAFFACVAFVGTAHAGRVEQFAKASINPNASNEILAVYDYGFAGMFISEDGSDRFKLLCGDAIDPSIRSHFMKAVSLGDSIYVPVFDGLWRGDKHGCNFQSVAEMAHHVNQYVTGDPLDPARVYVVTSDGADQMTGIAMNGIYLSTGGGPFMPFGPQADIFINNLFVVKNGTGRRFYESAVHTDISTNKAEHFVRVSDDDAKTWTTSTVPIDMYGPADAFADLNILAIDPANPDQLVVGITRDSMPDTVLYSSSQGKPGSWTMLAEVGTITGAAFTPDGSLYFGDGDQATAGFYVVDKPGAASRKLSDQWQVGCLQYNATTKKMYACNFYRFGTVDLTNGDFTTVVDMRCAEHFVQCPGAATQPTAACQVQLANAYCGYSHYSTAPLCNAYPPDPLAASITADIDYMCSSGLTVPKIGTAGAGGSASVAGASGGGGASAVAATGGSAGQSGTAAASAGTGAAGTAASPKPKSKGCRATPGQQSTTQTWSAWALMLAATWLHQRRERRQRRRY